MVSPSDVVIECALRSIEETFVASSRRIPASSNRVASVIVFIAPPPAPSESLDRGGRS